MAEETLQEACLRALGQWPEKGPPRDSGAWLIFVGRNAQLDGVRKQAKHVALPDEDQLSDLDDAERPPQNNAAFTCRSALAQRAAFLASS